jgi:two-component system response regulator AtoC
MDATDEETTVSDPVARRPLEPSNSADADGDALAALLVGRSRAMERVRERVRALAPLDVAVLVLGEPGSGRSRVVEALHRHGPLAGRSLLRVRPGMRPPRDARGPYHLDGVADLGPAEQAFWVDRLRVQGSDTRVFASSPCELAPLVREGHFDTRLFERLRRFVVRLPPLRARLEDLPALVRHLSRSAGERLGRPEPRVERSALTRLRAQPWPGNVAELADLIERLVAFAGDGRLTGALVEEVVGESARGVDALRRRRDEQQRHQLETALRECGGNLAEVARRIGMSRGAVIYRAQKYGLLARPRRRTDSR